MIPWTKQQLSAINTRGRDVIVSASAGTGKTSVMIERIFGLISEGYSLDRMLVVTFTNAAAADMKDKLARRLSKGGIKQQIKLLGCADIGTLHSWCKKLIAEYFYYTELDPDFEVLEGGSREKLFAEALQEVVDGAAESEGAAFETLTSALGGRGDEGLKNAITALYNHLIIRPDFEINLSDAQAGDKLREIFCKKAERLAAEAQELYVQTAQAGFERNIAALHELIACIKSGTAPVLSPRSRVGDGFYDLNESYKALKTKVTAFLKQAEDAEKALPQPAPFAELLLRLTKNLSEVFSRKKRAALTVDFNDLEHFALKILRSEAGEEIRKRYDFVFVDEYQDINPLQNHIIDCVKTEGRLFIVGDLKQSIYAFRGCEPEIFSDKIRLAGKQPDKTAVISLNDNHRSLPSVLRFVNDVFCRIMTRGFGGTDYAAEGRFAVGGTTDAETTDAETTDAETTDGEKEDILRADGLPCGAGIYLYQTEAQTRDGIYDLTADCGESGNKGAELAARLIKRILSGFVTADSETRPAAADDVAVLVRSGGRAVNALLKMLDGMGIRAEASESLRPSGCRQVTALIEYLKLIDNKYDDVALINCLKSRFGGFSDDELAQIRGFSPFAEYFYRAAEDYCQGSQARTAKDCRQGDTAYSAEINPEIGQRLTDFYKKLEYYRLLAQTAEAEELVGSVVSDFNYFHEAFLQGEAAAAALDAFLNSVPARGCSNLTEFLEGLSIPAAPVQSAGAVKIMTVHAAKGLEFPFVIILDTKDFNLSDLKEPIILFDSLCGLKNFDADSLEHADSAEWLLNKYSLQKRQKEEEMRLLYVALTRAKLGLYYVSEASAEDATPADAEACKSWIEWLLPVYFKYSARPPQITDAPNPPCAVLPVPALPRELKKSFDFVPQKSPLPPKTYVTALLNGQETEADGAVYSGATDLERAAYRGTLYHKAMELLDFYCDFEEQWTGLSEEIKRETVKAEIAAAWGAAGQCLDGYRIFKEQGFIADIPAAIAGLGGFDAATGEGGEDGFDAATGEGGEGGFDAATGKDGEDGSVLVQGIIDVLGIKQGGAVIIDYKTGALSPKYKKQLQLYAYAAQKILGLRIDGLFIYSFKQKRLLKIDAL